MRFGSRADICSAPAHVRFTPNSDIDCVFRHLCFGAEDEFIEVFVDTPIEDCMQRDPKGLYAKAKAGELKNFAGIDAPYETPISPEIHLRTRDHTASELAEIILRILNERGTCEASAD